MFIAILAICVVSVLLSFFITMVLFCLVQIFSQKNIINDACTECRGFCQVSIGSPYGSTCFDNDCFEICPKCKGSGKNINN
jgi:hypothetical protein